MPAALVTSPTDARERIELARWAWLDAKSKRTGSTRTSQLTHDTDGRPIWRGEYAAILDHFRRTVQQAGLDLDGDPSALALVAQAWASSSWMGTGRVIATATYNQRLAVVASFYTYARRHQLLGDNPIDLVERRPVQSYATARALESHTARSLLSHIDRTTVQGARDYALLTIGMSIGRPALDTCQGRNCYAPGTGWVEAPNEHQAAGPSGAVAASGTARDSWRSVP